MYSFCNCLPVFHPRLESDTGQRKDVEARSQYVRPYHWGKVGHRAPQAAASVIVPPEADHNSRDDGAEATVYPLRTEVLPIE